MRIAFVTPELAPYTPGGAGAAIAGLATLLAGQNDVTVFVVGEEARPTSEKFEIVWVPISDGDPFVARSEAAAVALSKAPTFDLVEFVDFDALSFSSLLDRKSSNTETSRVVIRVHGPSDLMFDAIGSVPDDLRVVIAREAESFRMADLVVASSKAISELVADRYGLDPDRVVVGALPAVEIPSVPLAPSPAPEVVCLGRLGEVKGSHDLVREMVPVLRKRSEVRLRFIGQDGWSVEGACSMREWLETQIPGELRHQVRFEGRVGFGELGQALSTAWFAVFPSRFEGYCLAADEVRGIGLPILVRDIPGFHDRMSEDVGALVVPCTPGALSEGVEELIDQPVLRSRLGSAPPPERDDPLALYRAQLPSPRHPRSQAGLATAAGQRVLLVAQMVENSLPGRLAHRFLKFTPEWAVKIGKRVAPKPLRRRLRGVISWGDEIARRRAADRRIEVLEAIERGEYSELSDPKVSVVIPCFNQGQFLEETLSSVFLQSYKSWEVIIVDDGSTDSETRGFLDQIDWPRIRMIRQRNRGLPAARNAGISEARGEFIVPLDADDQLEPEYFHAMVSTLDGHKEAAFAHCWATLFGDLDYVWVPRPYNPFLLLLSNSVIGCVLMRKQAWDAVGGYDETMLDGNEDWELWIRMMENGWGAVEVRDPLFRYRKHGVSMSVATESRFELGRSQIRERHRDLYRPESLLRMRRDHYPLVSLIGETQLHDPDFEAVPCTDLGEAVRGARGRYVFGSNECSAEELYGAIDRLESERRQAATACGDGFLWRRSYLMDSSSQMTVPAGVESDSLAGIRLDDWALPREFNGKPVVRQDPEGDILYKDTLL